jgi:antitoxin component YwqK of YwqJK toxin-antitoxin module
VEKVLLKKNWHPNGTIKEVYYTLKGKRHGEYKKLNEDGTELIVCTYQQGKIVGVLEEFEPNANRKLHYKNGKRHGAQFEYVAGKLSRKYFCENGQLQGEYVIYHPDEQIAVKCNVDKGQLNGKLINYVGGQRRGIYNYRRGKLHGECFKYDGKNYMVGYFCDGKPIKKWKEVDRNGKTVRTFIGSTLTATAFFRDTKWEISM